MVGAISNRGWSRKFEDPIDPPNGGKIVTLREAATHITALPKKEADPSEWQAAIEALILVADLGGPTMFAQIGMMRALNRDVLRCRIVDDVHSMPRLGARHRSRF